MFRHLVTIGLVLIVSVPMSNAGVQKNPARLVKIADNVETLRTGILRSLPGITAADTCLVRHDSGISWAIFDFVVGNELYKSLLDPSQNCPDPYPFTITDIIMPMYLAGGVEIQVSVDVEELDNSDPACPAPGQVIGAVSSTYNLQVPESAYWEISIPLDSPVTVNGPFFAGFFLANQGFNALDSPAVLTDNYPVPCNSYNAWDDSIGWIDLGDSATWDGQWAFPGRLVLYAAGIPGGISGNQPPSDLAIIYPADNDTLYKSTELLTFEQSASQIIEYVSFEYSSGGSWVEIGRDYLAATLLRNGVDSVSPGRGYGLRWDFSSLAEGVYSIRATSVDTLGRTSSQTIAAYLEPTPPIPRIVSPRSGEDICSRLQVIMNTPDEDLSYISIFQKDAAEVYSAGLESHNQNSYGDTDNDPNDGNSRFEGEFGDYYCGPVAAALAIKLWVDRGLSALMRENSSTISFAEMVERLAQFCKTRENLGTYDENLLAGLADYSTTHGDLLDFDMMRDPNYFSLRKWVEDEERTVILGLGGSPGRFVAVDGFSGWRTDGNFMVRVSSPFSGAIEQMAMLDSPGGASLQVEGEWQSVDLMISVSARHWNVDRTLIGTDFNGVDGWSFDWISPGMADNDLTFLRAVGTNRSGMSGESAILLSYNCASTFVAGDYDNDGSVSISDLYYLIEFLALGGSPPAGGIVRADANCDRTINLADIVYYMNFLFGKVAPPCH